MLGFVLPVAFIAIALYTIGLILSDMVGLKALGLIEGDLRENEKVSVKAKEKKATMYDLIAAL